MLDCNLCGNSQLVQEIDFATLDESGLRSDLYNRPDLSHDTVDYLLPFPESPQTPVVFVIDKSQFARNTGIFQSSLDAIGLVLEQGIVRKLVLIFLSEGVSYFQQATEYCVVDDSLVPVPVASLIFNLPQDASIIAKIVSAIKKRGLPERILTVPVHALFGAIEVCSEGGKVYLFSARNIDMTADDLKSAESACATCSISVCAFVCPPNHVDVDLSLIGRLASSTGGILRYYATDQVSSMGDDVIEDIERAEVTECAMKLRCSRGLSTCEVISGLFTDVHPLEGFVIPRVRSDQSFVFILKHDASLDEATSVFLQLACSYVDETGAHKLRVSTACIRMAATSGNFFKFSDTDAICNVLLRQTAFACLKGSDWLFKLRENLLLTCTGILQGYRANCSVRAPPGELVLPESLKNLPLMIQSILKLPCFQEEASMQKCQTYAFLFRCLESSIDLSSLILYTRIWQVTTEPPTMVPASIESLKPTQSYIMDTGTALLLYPGSALAVTHDSDLVDQLRLLSDRGHESARTALSWTEHLQNSRTETLPRLKLRLIRHVKPMAEDAFGSNPCYADWLCALHLRLQTSYIRIL